jgi:hypothetical protein
MVFLNYTYEVRYNQSNKSESYMYVTTLPHCNFLHYIVAIYICSMEITDLKSKMGITEMSLDQIAQILDNQLANDNSSVH